MWVSLAPKILMPGSSSQFLGPLSPHSLLMGLHPPSPVSALSSPNLELLSFRGARHRGDRYRPLCLCQQPAAQAMRPPLPRAHTC